MTLAQNRQQPLSGNKKILAIILSLLSVVGFSQSKGDFQRKYAESLDQFNAGDYAHAYEGFRMLTQGHKNNQFQELAHYYCGYAAYKTDKLLDAKFILVKSMTEFSEWKQQYETKYLLAIIALSEKDYHRAFELLSEIIFEKEIQEDVVKLIRKEVLTTPDLNIIIKEQALFPENFTLAKALADRLKTAATTINYRNLLQYLIQDYELNPKQYANVLHRKSVKKPVYNIAVLLPFELDGQVNWRKSSKELEMLEGVRLAVKKLEKETSSKFKIYAYDTGKDTTKVIKLLKLSELRQMDLIIGASASETGELVARFATFNQIHYINPLNGDPSLITDYSKLFKPSYDEIGTQLAEFSNDSLPKKRWVAIFYNSNLRDSLIADSYKKQMELLGKRVVTYKSIARQNTSDIDKLVQKFNFDSLSHVAVFNKEDLFATSFMSALESKIASIESNENYKGGRIYIPIIAPYEWLDIHIIQFKQFVRRDVHFYNTDYIDYSRKEPVLFRKEIGEVLGLKPSNDYAAVGYDLMLIYGKWLSKYGNMFVSEMAKEGYVKGYNFTGVNYSNGYSNTIVPILKLNKDYKLVWENHE